MRILVLDTRSGARQADLFVVDCETYAWQKLRLGYVPEISYNPLCHELVVVDTELGGKWWRRQERFWLKCYAADTLQLVRTIRTPQRPMYTGYPGRSTRVTVSPSGRYVFLLESQFVLHTPHTASAYRQIVSRYDRQLARLERGQCAIDSCTVAFGHMGSSDEELYFHLSCDYPSTVAFGTFSSPEMHLIQMEQLEARVHCPQETCGSWLDTTTQSLYCVTGEGTIYQVKRQPMRSALLVHLPLPETSSVPLAQVDGGGGYLFIGMSRDTAERSLSLASEVWKVSLAAPQCPQMMPLPFATMNFVVTPDGNTLVGTSPYERAVFFMDTVTGRLAQRLEVGVSPAEVQVLP